MKKLNVVMCIVAITLLHAAGYCQVAKAPSYSARSILEFSRSEYAKIWTSNENGVFKMRSECVGKNAMGLDCSGTIVILRSDSAKVYTFKSDENIITAMPMPMKKFKDDDLTEYLNKNVMGFDYEQERNVSKESLGTKVIESYECVGVKTVITTVNRGGIQETGCNETWKCPSLYDLTILTKTGCGGYGEGVLTIDYKFGHQPDELFEIPKDKKIQDMGSLISKITGSDSYEENNKYVDDKEKAYQDAQKEANEKLEFLNDPNKSDSEKLQDAVKMLQGLGK